MGIKEATQQRIQPTQNGRNGQMRTSVSGLIGFVVFEEAKPVCLHDVIQCASGFGSTLLWNSNVKMFIPGIAHKVSG